MRRIDPARAALAAADAREPCGTTAGGRHDERFTAAPLADGVDDFRAAVVWRLLVANRLGTRGKQQVLSVRGPVHAVDRLLRSRDARFVSIGERAHDDVASPDEGDARPIR